MNGITLIAVIASIGVLNILCFLIGVKTGSNVVNNEPIKIPKIKSPMEIYKEKEALKEYEQEMNDISKSLENIDNYGSDKPQQEI